MARSRRGLKSGTVQRMLRLAPEAEERASAREERGVRDMEGGGRGSDGERARERETERVAEARGRILSWKMGERDSPSLFPFHSFFLYLFVSLSLFDEEDAQSGL